MVIAYTSENKIYLAENGNKSEIPCGRITKYKEALDSIRRRSEWKNTGSGAQFMGTAVMPDSDEAAASARITGICENNGRLVYGVALDQSSALYQRSFDRNETDEGLILSGNDLHFGAFDCIDGKMAVSMGATHDELHICTLEPPSSVYTEHTDGDTMEQSPYWSRCNKNRIYFSTSGNARNQSGAVGAVSPASGSYLDLDSGEMNEFLSDEKTDYLKIKDDKYGNIYYIRQPYGGEQRDDGVKFTDILLFPFRLFKGLFGWLNFMCTIWGGESLKSGGSGLPSELKSKQRTEKDIIIDGNIINAKRLAEAADLKDDDMTGLMPAARVLVKREADGTETVIAKSVLDYTVCRDGRLLYSNGRQIISYDGTSHKVMLKARFAMNIIECGE